MPLFHLGVVWSQHRYTVLSKWKTPDEVWERMKTWVLIPDLLRSCCVASIAHFPQL